MFLIHEIIKSIVEDSDDFTAFVVDDCFRLLVPQNGDCESGAVIFVCFEVQLTELLKLVRCLGRLCIVEVVRRLALSFVTFACV